MYILPAIFHGDRIIWKVRTYICDDGVQLSRRKQ